MAETAILVIASTVLLIAAVSGRLSRFFLSEPLVAAAIGVGIGAVVMDPITLDHPAVLTFLQLTLALVLFADAARMDLQRLRDEFRWPARMLGIGLPAAILGGAIAAFWLLGLPPALALLVGVILVPTDAALAEPVLEADEVPTRIRQSINIEAGLNDGLALPALFIAIGLVDAETSGNALDGVLLVVQQIGVGVVGGVVAGFVGGWIIGGGARRGWMSPLHTKIAAVALALAAFAAVQLAGGSGFVATFVAGAVLAFRIPTKPDYLYSFAEAEGHALVLVAFLLIGVGPIHNLLQEGVARGVWVVALVALIVIRPLAIAISLIGERLRPSTVAFLGWFGPRGLATVVFFLVAAEEVGGLPDPILSVVTMTVAMSIVLHGVTARPASRWLARRLESLDDDEIPEMGEAYDHPMG